ncbi:MAG: Ig-like domain-containing protein [Oscillospiraceae bacterium]
MKRVFISAFLVVMALLLCSGMVYPAMAAGSAPVAENLELRTFRNVSVSGQLSALDPENDVVKFEISTQPVKGHIELATDGSFVYTPNQDKKGKDYFGYRATDSEGNVSQEATVIIRIDKQKKDVSYSDMKGSAGNMRRCS